jgi:hypothetical protein
MVENPERYPENFLVGNEENTKMRQGEAYQKGDAQIKGNFIIRYHMHSVCNR